MGAALLAHTYAFVAVFVAGVALRHEELDATGEQMPSEALADVERSHKREAATSPELAHAYMAESMMAFAVEIERIVEFGLMLLVGSVISAHWRELLDWHAIWPALFLLLVAQPIGTALSLYGSAFDRQQRILTAWMGIRGVGAFYYLLFALEHSRSAVRPLAPAILTTIVISVFVHGCSATPALKRYMRRYRRAPSQDAKPRRKRTASAGKRGKRLRRRSYARQATACRGTPNATSSLPAISTGAHRASLSRQPAHPARRARSAKPVGRASTRPTNRGSR